MPTALQAHRGSPDPAGGVRENRLEAFVRTRSLGAGGVGAVHQLATADLPDHVPLLVDALAACAGMVVNIEVKNLPTESAFDPSDRCARDVVDLVEATEMQDSVIVSSFWAGALTAAFWAVALTAVRAAGSGVATGLQVLSSFDAGTAVTGAVDLGCAAVHLPVALVTPETVAAAHGAGLVVAAWTVTDETDLAAMLGAGVDTVVTDDVDRARRAVDRT
ncbi:MAG TPA: glycerophosphodiester phosphodiesterase, partial [Acidimicrobiales bacterium]